MKESKKELCAKIAEYEGILADEKKVLAIVKEEALEIKRRFADERLTEIAAVSGEVDIEDLIPEEQCVFTLTTFGYIKRIPASVYTVQKKGGKGVKGMSRREEDVAETMFTCSSHDYIMFFTTKGRAYRLKGYEIPEGSRQSKGMNVVNLLPVEADEKISAMIRVPDFGEDEHYLCMVTRKGIIKRTELDAYKNIRKSGIIAITLDEGDELAWVWLTGGNDDILVATKNGFAIRFNENDARAIGRTARGVRAIDLRDGDEVVGMCAINKDDEENGAMILTVSENGIGRRSAISEYHLQSRSGKGSINYKTEKYGLVAAVCLVRPGDDVILISSDGIVIRIDSESVNSASRTSRGVNVMKTSDGEKVVSVTAVKREEETEEAETESETGEAETAEEETENE